MATVLTAVAAQGRLGAVCKGLGPLVVFRVTHGLLLLDTGGWRWALLLLFWPSWFGAGDRQ